MGNFQIVDLNVNISLEFMNFIMKLVTEICHFNFLSFYYLSKNFIKFIPISSRTFQHGDVDLIAQLVKKSACNAGDPSSIPGSGRSAGEGIGYPLQYSWASLVAQLVKNLPAMRETWVRSLGWKDPLEKGKAIHTGILAWRIPWTV